MTADHPTREERYAAEVERVLRENGLTDEPHKYDSSIHSWRCEHPDMYGPCECFQELRDDLAAALVAADPAPAQPEVALSDGQSVQIVQCVGRIQRGEEPVDALLTIIERVKADAYAAGLAARTAANPLASLSDRAQPEVALSDEELRELGFQTPGSGGLLQERIERILAARAAQPVPAPEVSHCGQSAPAANNETHPTLDALRDDIQELLWGDANLVGAISEAVFEGLVEWVAGRERDAKARAWDEGYGSDLTCNEPRTNPYALPAEGESS